jgi:hypothetical protein
MARQTPSSRGRKAARESRARAHARILEAEAEARVVWSRIEARIQASLATLGTSTREQIVARLRREFERESDARRRAIRRGVEATGREGLAAGPRVATAAFAELGRSEPIDPARAVELATLLLDGEQAAGGITLSRRMHAHDEATTRLLGAELAQSVRAGQAVATAAQGLLEVDDVRVYLPRYVTELQEAVADAGPMLAEEVNKHVAAIRRLQDPQLRAAGQMLLDTAATANAADLQRQVRYWVRDRALYQERVVVRTEGARAFNAAFVESTREQPWTKGYRWELSPQHPKPDVCDLFASQALDGLGPGGYRAETLPALPAHPNCFCFTTSILDDEHFARELATINGTPEPPRAWEDSRRETASEWLARQPSEKQQVILGPSRLQLWQQRPSDVIGERGHIAPLWRAQGQTRPPVQVRGPRVRAASVDPFREAGSRRAR